ncbi:MAG: aminofutalosine synthase MqnE [Bacteroidetes bacterium]|nr:aminofutalosine synthase MqnE [Rhodothermia bacterium]MCS7155927.1 aminofutalosine synthase MqnE [Bacteroidota bacterium]MCX7905933.1 aminofutalosine synthase MqnE [Bacteroidota bacterium]MDW8138100.1 aminofutalosine synthase MqnE [Bacteroidota bacterium]MDW8285784.1 aminofutalosine synthase MqnE [Bacteroidota bacterium]
MADFLSTLLDRYRVSQPYRKIAEKVAAGERLGPAEGLALYRCPDVSFLGALANFVRERLHGDYAYFNRNFHIEPTNICIFDCAFCSFARRPGQEGAWEYGLDEIEQIVQRYKDKPVTEVHIVGGVHPKRGVEYYGEMLRRIKAIRPDLHIKAFTAVEIAVMAARSRMGIREALQYLRSCGLDSLPGGGAEIFHPEVREQICDSKASGEQWLEIHRTAHELGIPSTCTMLYGHLERYEHRIDHLEKLRNLQDETGGFQAFIPLKFKRANNRLSHLREVPMLEDLKNYAVCRLYLDNIPHIKAYWPMIGRQTAQISLSFGVDDVDGTIDDTTRIYAMAGGEEHPAMTTNQLIRLIRQAGRIPVERDTLYRVIRIYTQDPPPEPVDLPVLA